MQTYLEKRQPAQKMARFYRMAVLPNLFGEWTLLREWGRIGQGGQVRMDWFADESQAVAALIMLEVAKRKRGYWVEPQQLAMLGLGLDGRLSERRSAFVIQQGVPPSYGQCRCDAGVTTVVGLLAWLGMKPAAHPIRIRIV